MGKKIALGCLVVFLVVVIGGGYWGYTSFLKPVVSNLGSIQNSAQQINEKNNQIRNQSSYTPPQSGEITPRQVDNFVSIQQEIRRGLENVLGEFQEKYDELGQQWEQREPTFREMMNVGGDLLAMYSDAKQVQVDAINNAGLSLEEYRFVQQSFYHALGVELFSYNIDQIARAAAEGNINVNMEEFEAAQEQMREVPERNRELVAPFADSAEDWLVFAWWGL
jgi:hypothetical protein